jgi:conjugative relaxase-like TrwC/TraI family protein
VLKIHVVHEGGHRYYVDDLVPGRAEGTLVAGEEPGVWTGSASAELGLVDRVEADSFAEVMAGRDPGSGRPLRAGARARTVVAYDLSFCAPKSVSILHLLGPRELAGEAGAGHRAAVTEAAGYLERSALAVRRRRDGVGQLLPTTGAVAGGFLHRTSRALDPHLHTHLVVANVAHGVDGGWFALDSRRLHRHLGAAQGIYHARLRLELTERMGASWEVGPTGLGDVAGVPAELRHLFSQRAADMARFEFQRYGGTAGRRRNGAFHATRPAKEAGHTVGELIREWRRRAADLGYDLGDLTRVVGLGGRGRDRKEVDLGEAERRLGAVAKEQRPLARHDLVALFAATSATGTRAGSLESLATSVIDAAGLPLDRAGVPPQRSAGPAAITRFEPRWRAEDLSRALREIAAPACEPREIAPPGREHPGGLDRDRRVDRTGQLERARGIEGGGPEPELRTLHLGRGR